MPLNLDECRFKKQDEAFEYQRQYPEKRCFTKELPARGARHFIIADLDEFWDYYRNEYDKPRHFYELIQDGYPCRLYFDLEFKKSENPKLEQEKVLNSFIDLVNKLIKDHYGFDLTKNNWLLLESSTNEKFSVHATVHFPNNYLFPSNVAMRVFINDLLHKMSKTGVGIIKKDGIETYLCDTSVYSRNRQFRFYLSAKAGKDAFLEYKKDCIFYKKVPKDEKVIFLDSLAVPANYKKCPLLNVKADPTIVLHRARIQ